MVDITSHRFGKLTAISRFGRYGKNSGYKHTYWVCKCDCGTTKIVALHNLRSRYKPTASCGCESRKHSFGKLVFPSNPALRLGKTKKQCKCKYCKKEFTIPIASTRKYCSRDCVTLSQKKLYICEICGKEFSKRRSRNVGRFCGEQCVIKWSKTRKRQIKLECSNGCGEVVERTPFMVKKQKNHFCSPECSQQFQKKNCPPSKKKKRKYHLNPQLRWQVLKRDNFTCQYCGAKPIDGVPLHVDHKVPRSLGGRDVIDNLITACEECNLGKTDTIDEFKQLGMEFTVH